MTNSATAAPVNKMNGNAKRRKILARLNESKLCYLMLLPTLVFFFIFCYIPMSGIAIAFQDYVPGNGFFSGPWVGFEHFSDYFNGIYFTRTLFNTLALSGLSLLICFPAPIIFALMLNEIRHDRFKKTVQTITYLPHFISIVIICGLIRDLLASDGLFNMIGAALFGLEQPVMYLQEPGFFRAIYIFSSVWQGIGWGSIIYLSALSSIDPGLYDAAEIDGCTRWKKIIHVNIPGIMPTIIILFIMAIGGILGSSTEKILLLYNSLTYETADVISTYIRRVGLEGSMEYSFSTAVELMNNVVGFILLSIANFFSKRVSETSLW